MAWHGKSFVPSPFPSKRGLEQPDGESKFFYLITEFAS